MNLRRIRWGYAIGGAVAAEALMIVAAIAWVAIYSYFIHPGETPAFYEQYAQVASPWVAVLTGIPIFYVVCRWIANRLASGSMYTAMALFAIYLLMDAPVVLLSRSPSVTYWLAAIGYVSKLAACYFGAKGARHDLPVFALAFVLFQGPLMAQPGNPAAHSFEVASVKPNVSNERMYYGLQKGGNRLIGRNISLKGWIQIAYQVKDFQITGGPGWIASEHFDIEAKTETAVPLVKDMLLLLQALLAERFQLAMHRESKESSVYALLIARGGLKMKPSADQTLWVADYPDGAPEGKTLTGAGPKELSPGRFLGDAIPISLFTALLAGPLGRTVINRTSLTGRYDIDLRYAPGSGQADSGDVQPADSSAPSLFTALRDQLGLRLESGKGAVDVLVIDRVEHPSSN